MQLLFLPKTCLCKRSLFLCTLEVDKEFWCLTGWAPVPRSGELRKSVGFCTYAVNPRINTTKNKSHQIETASSTGINSFTEQEWVWSKALWTERGIPVQGDIQGWISWIGRLRARPQFSRLLPKPVTAVRLKQVPLGFAELVPELVSR